MGHSPSGRGRLRREVTDLAHIGRRSRGNACVETNAAMVAVALVKPGRNHGWFRYWQKFTGKKIVAAETICYTVGTSPFSKDVMRPEAFEPIEPLVPKQSAYIWKGIQRCLNQPNSP